jgi:hypothetical protein
MQAVDTLPDNNQLLFTNFNKWTWLEYGKQVALGATKKWL